MTDNRMVNASAGAKPSWNVYAKREGGGEIKFIVTHQHNHPERPYDLPHLTCTACGHSLPWMSFLGGVRELHGKGYWVADEVCGRCEEKPPVRLVFDAEGKLAMRVRAPVLLYDESLGVMVDAVEFGVRLMSEVERDAELRFQPYSDRSGKNAA